MEHPEVLKWLIICSSVFLITLIFALGARFKWFSSLSLGKSGLDIKAKEDEKKEIEKKFQSGSSNYLMDCKIHELDNDLILFALDKSKTLRRAMTIELSKTVDCHSTRRALASCLRYPLYDASRKNNFKDKLCPENIKEYTDNVIKEMIYEYQDFAIEREMSRCPLSDKARCPELPSLDDLLIENRNQLINDWALPLRKETINTCKKKIEIYKTYIPVFEDLEDQVKIKVCLSCIDKNENYIKNLARKPDKDSGEF